MIKFMFFALWPGNTCSLNSLFLLADVLPLPNFSNISCSAFCTLASKNVFDSDKKAFLLVGNQMFFVLCLLASLAM